MSEPNNTMTTIKVSEATGPALDWLVAKCEDLPLVLDPMGFSKNAPNSVQAGWWLWDAEHTETVGKEYSPSTNWAQGGPIIDREHISLVSPSTSLTAFWQADIGHAHKFTQWDHNPLIAATRCYVASTLGDEVEVPEGLA